jgi:hypothetical protein
MQAPRSVLGIRSGTIGRVSGRVTPLVHETAPRLRDRSLLQRQEDGYAESATTSAVVRLRAKRWQIEEGVISLPKDFAVTDLLQLHRSQAIGVASYPARADFRAILLRCQRGRVKRDPAGVQRGWLPEQRLRPIDRLPPSRIQPGQQRKVQKLVFGGAVLAANISF